MPTWSEKMWDKETGGDKSPEEAKARLIKTALDDAIVETLELLEALRLVEYEAGKDRINFDLTIHNQFLETPRGWVKAINQYLLELQQDYEKNPPQIKWPDTVHMLAEVESLRAELAALNEKYAKAMKDNYYLIRSQEHLADMVRVQTMKLEEAKTRAIKAEQPSYDD
jgi:hypothetical protein